MKKGIWALVWMLWGLPVQADLYTVSAVPVSIEAESAVAAKEIALDEAAQRAFPLLMQQLVLSSNAADITAEADQIAGFVQGVSVANEKNTPTKYMADVTVQFKQEAIRAFLTERKIPFITTEPPHFLLIPVYRTDDGQVLIFESDNPLFYVMKSAMPRSSIYQFIVPTGDEQDRAIQAETAGDVSAIISRLSERYKTDNALIAEVVKTGTVYRIHTTTEPQNEASGGDVTFAVSSLSQNIPAVMKQIMKKTVAHMEQKFKSQQLHRAEVQGAMTILFPVRHLAEWTALEKRLNGLAFVKKTQVRAVYQGKIYAELTYTSDNGAFLEQMARAGFNLAPMGLNYIWQKEEFEGLL